MTKLGIGSITLSTLFAASFAASVSADPISLLITGNVDPVCEVTGLSTVSYNAGPLDQGLSLSSSALPIDVKCNYKSGAVITLATLNGGLTSAEATGEVVDYKATLTAGALGAFALNTSSLGAGGTAAGVFSGATLAAGVPSTLQIEILDDATFAGDYTDTLTVTIAQN
ncbi:hypothetical protein L4D06_03265 [Enterovibrio makurazakiensis]|uniref:Spore coat protein U domain-containing protein n=1 Tax=Enterovibrio gelatinilyticus TaxID=2899819 RepID=A0ABT5R2P5_9GAMM|nr:hypothetical protein [Enterovibrio sp. ZSDZ42]MDD1794548.1 hypothetical protein [Enterovibrio sp. ZSDZ42]